MCVHVACGRVPMSKEHQITNNSTLVKRSVATNDRRSKYLLTRSLCLGQRSRMMMIPIPVHQLICPAGCVCVCMCVCVCVCV